MSGEITLHPWRISSVVPVIRRSRKPRFRIRERRHNNEMNLEKEKVLRDSQHDMGWKAPWTR